MVYNGEIYNYRELRQQLTEQGCTFHTRTDNEVLLQAWITWGEECLQRLEGMFAFVIYDHHDKTLSCVRDAFGIKPFYYLHTDDVFLFASELPAIIELMDSKPALDWQRCYDYLVIGDYDSKPRTFFSGIKNLQPGHLLSLNLADGSVNESKCWWKPSINQVSQVSFKDAAEMLRHQFLENVKLHLRSDVPLGSALSGGIDSSAVVCAIRHLEPEVPIHTFSFIASDSDLSEETWVDMVNTHVDAVPHKVFVSGENLKQDLEDMIRIQGEPFGSTSIYAQYKVFQLARDCGVTVTLDGQGADELLAGYVGYAGERILSLIETGRISGALDFARNWSRWPRRDNLTTWLYFAALIVPDKLYPLVRKFRGEHSVPQWLDRSALLDAGVDMRFRSRRTSETARGRRLVAELRHNLTEVGIPALLRHADRNAMRFSIESRVPFLTIPMANLVMGLPEDYLISGDGETKSVFRAAMRGVVPDEILDRKTKLGFATPEKSWLFGMRNEIREWLKQAEEIPCIDSGGLIRDFDDIMSGRKPFSWQVWRWVNFLKWHEIYG